MKKKTIMIVDDDPELRQELSEILSYEGYIVLQAGDPGGALKMLVKNLPDLIILDYKLPGMTGIELLQEIRKTNKKSKIIMVSGKPFIEKLLEEKTISCMISGVLNKPFAIDIFLDKVKNLL